MRPNQNRKLLSVSIIAICSGLSAQVEASLASNAVLNFDDGVYSCVNDAGTVPDNCAYGLRINDNSGSYFGYDTNSNGIISLVERVVITNAGAGLVLGVTQNAGEIDNAWMFSANPGSHYTDSALTIISVSGNTATIDMSGWGIWWGDPAGDALADWATEGTVATVVCDIDCSAGEGFVFDYYIPNISNNWGGAVPYSVHLEGTISAVPVPAAIWLFGSGLLGLIGLARKK